MEKIDINFIITCYNREDYWPFLKKIIESYEKINPHIAYCYSGVSDDVDCDFRCENRGHIEGDTDLMIGGYNVLKNNGVNKWIKLSIDSWLMDENKIIEIFDIMTKGDMVYAGNYWTGTSWWATDIFFAVENNYGFMKRFTEGAINYIEKIDYSIEGWIRVVAEGYGKYYIIPDREPISGNFGNRFFVDSLSWTMEHDLESNIQRANNYLKKLVEVNPNIKLKKI
jgi:hypothetical protein